jgi:hypothetical protein
VVSVTDPSGRILGFLDLLSEHHKENRIKIRNRNKRVESNSA